MKTMEIEIFEPAIQKAHVWLNEIAEELKWQDKHKAYLALRATLQALRDRLTLEETAHLGAQLPMLIRGVYYDGWKPDGKAVRKMDREAFLDRISGTFRNDPDIDPEEVVRAVFRFLSKKVTDGEIEDIKRIMPADLRELWP